MAAFTETMTINSTSELISNTLDEIKKRQNKRAELKRPPKVLDGVMMQLTTAEALLTLVKDNRELQTDAVRKEVDALLALFRKADHIIDELYDLPSQSCQSEPSDNPSNERLNNIQDELKNAFKTASLQILEVTVGLSGSQEGVYHVSFDILSDINEKVKKVLEKNLAFMDFLLLQKQQAVQNIGPNRIITLQPADINAFKERALQAPINTPVSTEPTRASVYANTATGRLNVITGNLGVGSGYISTFTGTSTVHHNQMGADSSIITGDVGNEAALRLLELLRQ